MSMRRSGGECPRDLSDVVHYTRQDLTHVLRRGLTKIDEWLKSGTLHSYKIDGTVFVHREDVDDFVSRHRIGQQHYQLANQGA
jgi:hypothetical protein